MTLEGIFIEVVGKFMTPRSNVIDDRKDWLWFLNFFFFFQDYNCRTSVGLHVMENQIYLLCFW